MRIRHEEMTEQQRDRYERACLLLEYARTHARHEILEQIILEIAAAEDRGAASRENVPDEIEELRRRNQELRYWHGAAAECIERLGAEVRALLTRITELEKAEKG